MRCIPIAVTTGALVFSCAAAGPQQVGQPRVGQPQADQAVVRQEADDSPQRFQALRRDYIRRYWDSHPIKAAEAGLHQYDGMSPDFSMAGIEAWLVYNKQVLLKLREIDPNRLAAEDQLDRDILIYACGNVIFQLEDLAAHRSNPSYYNTISEGLLNYISRDYAPLAIRMSRAVQLLGAVPRAFEQAKANLNDVIPQAYVNTAVENIEGSIAFFQKDIIAAFAEIKNEKLQADLRKSANAAAQATSRFVEHLKSDKLPKADGNFALGREKYRRMMKLTEGIDLTAEQLLAVAEQDLQRNLARVRAIADSHFDGINAADLMARMSSNMYTAEELIPSIRAELGSIRQFLVEQHIVTLPAPLEPLVAETPPFMRWGTAFLSAPGGFEALADQAYYYVTPIDPKWEPQEQREWLEMFNKYVATNTSVHEAYPGHFVDYLHTRNAPSDVQKIFRSYAAEEGWAHYCEEMMIEEGWGSHDPMYEVGMLQDALLRDCRFVCSVKMHCSGMSLEEATQFFMANTFYGELPAYKEAVRGTFDPGYLKYTLGKLQIMKLREDYRKKLGRAPASGSNPFTLQKFHDELLSHGMPPLDVTRRRLLGRDAGPSL